MTNENGAGVEMNEMLDVVRKILQFMEEIAQEDVEKFNHKVAMIEDIKKKYPWLEKPRIYEEEEDEVY